LSPNLLLYGLICLMLACWSGNYIAAKIVFRELPAELVICLRTMVSAVVMIPIFWRQSRRNPVHLSLRDFGLLLALGFGGITMNQVFWTFGTSRTTVVHSSMIMGTTPLWVLLIAGAIGLERITATKVAGLLIALSGVVLLQFSRAKGAAGGPTLWGDFLMLLCAMALAGMTAYGKLHKPKTGGIGVNTVGYVVGSIALLPLLWWAGRNFDFSRVSARAWLGVVYMGAISSVTGYLIYYYALARIPASRMAAFQYLQPVFASILAVLILGEHLSAGALGAGAMIFTGVVVTERFG
jgi:drug/metabolite transporter (DMT)-like permease